MPAADKRILRVPPRPRAQTGWWWFGCRSCRHFLSRSSQKHTPPASFGCGSTGVHCSLHLCLLVVGLLALLSWAAWAVLSRQAALLQRPVTCEELIFGAYGGDLQLQKEGVRRPVRANVSLERNVGYRVLGGSYAPVSSVAAHSIVEDLSCEDLDAESKPLRLLFASCGDPRHLLWTIRDVYNKYAGKERSLPPLELHANDPDLHIVARDIVLLVAARRLINSSVESGPITNIFPGSRPLRPEWELGEGEDPAARRLRIATMIVSVWIDTTLTRTTRAFLNSILDSLMPRATSHFRLNAATNELEQVAPPSLLPWLPSFPLPSLPPSVLAPPSFLFLLLLLFPLPFFFARSLTWIISSLLFLLVRLVERFIAFVSSLLSSAAGHYPSVTIDGHGRLECGLVEITFDLEALALCQRSTFPRG